MKKWYRPEVSAQRDDILKRFYGFEEAQHHVYAVVAHIRGEKLPIYVGETARPRKRFEQHLAVAWGGREVDNKAGKWERELVHRGGTLEFHGLEGTTDRVRGLALESAWGRALCGGLDALWPTPGPSIARRPVAAWCPTPGSALSACERPSTPKSSSGSPAALAGPISSCRTPSC